MNYLPNFRILQIQGETEKDESQGWHEDKNALPPIISPYFNTRDGMSIQDALVFKGERMVVPSAARGELLTQQSMQVSLLASHVRGED